MPSKQQESVIFDAMDEFTADAFVNREEPIPVITFSGKDGASSDTDTQPDKLKKNLSSSKLKEKLYGIGGSPNDLRSSLQDRLFTK